MRKKIFLYIIFFIFSCSFSRAAYIENIPCTLIQPSGDTIYCFVSGDEFYHYYHDQNGYTIIQNIETGYYVYAIKEGDFVVPSEHIVGKANPRILQLEPRVRKSNEEIRAIWNSRMLPAEEIRSSYRRSRAVETNHGNINNLVIFIRFLGDADLTTPFSTVDNMFNESTSGANSMYNYFKQVSYQQLYINSSYYPAPSGNTILSYEDIYARNYYLPYSSSNPSGYSTETQRRTREFALLERAINYVKSSIHSGLNIDYNQDGLVDNICFVVKGNVSAWSDLLWPHRWSLYDRTVLINGKRAFDFNFQLEGATGYFNNAVLCHEMFHTLGAPDLYHYSTDWDHLVPVGRWDIMENTANPPQHMGAYMKYVYGNWIDSIPEITRYGTYTLRSLGSGNNSGKCYKIATNDPNQFILLEYRRTTDSFESMVYGSGIVIYRIDQNYGGNADYDGSYYFDEVYVFRPGGTTTNNGNLAQSFYSSNSGRTQFNLTSNPAPFLTDGTAIGITIEDITSVGDSIQFRYGPLSSEIVTNPSSLSFQGTILNPPSIKSTTIIGNYLTDSITITIASPTSYFQISKDQLSWSNQIKIPPTGGVCYTKFNTISTGDYQDSLICSSPGASNKIIHLEATICGAVDTFPWHENFESGSIPYCWSEEYAYGTVSWDYRTGAYSGSSINSAHSGNYNAYFAFSSFSAFTTKLISPIFDLSGMINPELSFWHAQEVWNGDQDELKIYYKTQENGAWTLLQYYNSDIPVWTEHRISLPNPSSQYLIAFEGINHYGYGVVIDDISIYENLPQNITLSDSSYNFTTLINTTGDIDSTLITGHYLTDPISVTTSPPFEISLNKISWSSTVQMNSAGGTLYLRYTPTTTDSICDTMVITSDTIIRHIYVCGTPILPSFSIVATTGNNGTISPSGNVTVYYGDTLQFVPAPNVGYEVEHITVDGTVVDSLTSFTFYNITANHSINVTFKKIQFNIVATAGNNGTISPSGNVTIDYGDNLQFVPAPNVGYEVEHITIDGTIVDSLASFTFYNITANHSINVTFKKIQFNIVATAGNNGTISPSGNITVYYGDTLQFVPAPNVGYEVEHITVDGTVVDSLTSFTFYNITANHSINVTFKKIQFNIVATAGNNGTISPSGNITVYYGDNLQFVPAPNVGYEVEHITIDGTVVDSLASFTFYNITNNHTIHVTFKKIQFNIVATAGNNGTISPAGNITVDYGDTLQFVPAPNVGYEVEHITVDGTVVDSLASFTFYNITANHSINVTFKKIQFNIISTAGNNGTISPAGNITVDYGDTLQIVPAPDVGYEVEHITVDGTVVDSLASFTFYNITNNHTIHVTFKKIQFNIISTAGNNGTISPAGNITVDYGDTLQFVPAPNVGYEVEHITIDGTVVDSLTSFTLYNITANHSINVTFKKIRFNIVATAGNNGTISPSGNITVYYGDNLQFVPAPNVGYEVEHITIDGTVVDSLTSFTLYNITANHSINVTFKKIRFNIVATAGNDGTISPSGNITVYYGDTLQFVPAPNVGYEVEHITVDGTVVDSLTSFTFYNITANHSINVTFKKIQFNIVATAGNDGTISPSGNITVYYGDTLQFVPAPNVGYEVEHITVDGTVVDSLTSFTFYNITANHSINVTFKKIQFNIVATAGNNGTISPSGNITVYYGDNLQFVPAPNVGYEVEHITIDGTVVDSLTSFTLYNITANHSINVTFKKIRFNIVATAGNDGTISPSGNITVYYGDTLQFVPAPNVGYEVEHITVDGAVVDSLASFTFFNITANHTIHVTFKKIQFNIVATAGNNGTISPSGNITVYYGDTLQFVPAPNVGYEVEHITIDGAVVDSLTSFTLYNITANHSIHVTFKKIQFNIVATAGNNGTISPSGNITIYYGDTLQFVPTPNVGYEVEHITIDGTVVDSLTSFTLYNITANHSINVTFKKIRFNIVATAGNDGTISPSGNITVYYGDTLQFVPAPNVGYEVEHITVDGAVVDSLASFTFFNITANHTIHVTFKKIQFNIVATAGNNGTISPSGNITIYYGDTLQFVPAPNVGYEVEHITVDGAVVDSLTSFTLYNITANHSIHVTFKKIQFNIVATAGNNGTISPSGNITVYYGDTLQFVPTPNVGNEVEHITVDGNIVDSLASFTFYNITANHNINVTFKKIQFNIVATAGNNGTISPSGNITVYYGDNLQFVPTPNVGYEVEHITVDGTTVDSLASFTFYNITANHSINVTFKKIQFNILATAGNNGTISPSGNITVYYGDTLQFVPAPNVGYEVEHITIDGTVVDSFTSFTLYNITANHSIHVTFKKIQFNIVATAGNNGTISPSGNITVYYGDTLQFVPAPNVGYEVEHITVDGTTVDSLASFTLYNITANHSIHVTFKKIQFNIVATAGNNGTISPSGSVTIDYGDTLQFIPSPNVGYEVEHITIDGAVVDSLTSFTLYNITANHSINVTFKKIRFNIVATAGNDGTISPSGNITVYYGDTLQFVPAPNVGYEVEHITVDGTVVDSLTSFTFYNITANHSINVTFKKIQFNIVATAGNDGTISPSGNITVYYGDTLQFVPAPNVGYEVEHITVDGTVVDSLTSFTFYNITANHSINVTFKKIQFNIVATAGNNGTISPSGNITIYYGDTLQFVPTPNVGYEVEHITVDGTVVDSLTSFTLYNITANHSIHVTFKKIQFNIVATAGNNGTISPSGSVTIDYGDTLQFIPSPNVGYEVEHITIDGAVVDSLASFTFYNITANHNINVTFKKIQFNIVATAGNNGAISPSGNIPVYFGDTLQFVPTPNVGYEVEHITVDGTIVDSLASFTFFNIIDNHSIHVTFKSSSSTSIISNKQSLPYLIYPNPATQKITFECERHAELDRISIYSASGQLLFSTLIQDQKTVINIQNWTNGIYFIQVHLKNKTIEYESIIKL